MPDEPFRTISARTVFRNPWIALEEHELEAATDGHRFTYTYLSVRPSVMVVGLTGEGEIPIVRQYRYPSRGYNFELPGGGTAGRPAVEAARWELEEEAGFAAERLEKIGEFVTYCGLADEICNVVFASGLRPVARRPERTERIEAHTVGYPRLLEMIRTGEFRDGMGLAALHVARERLERALAAR